MQAEDNTVTDPARLQRLAGDLGIEIDEPTAATVLSYLDAMLEVGKHINLTAIRDREQAVILHALDSLAFGLSGIRPRNVLDLGTGNGFPGVAVALLHPSSSVVLVDRTAKKLRAIGTCLLTARVPGIETMHVDAKQAPGLHRDMRAAFDLVTARAVGTPELCAELAAPLLRPQGHLALWLDERTELPQRLQGFAQERVWTYNLPEPAPRTRRLALLRRV